MLVDTASDPADAIPSTLTLTGSASTITYARTDGGGYATLTIRWVYWYASAGSGGAVAKVGCESSKPPPPPPP